MNKIRELRFKHKDKTLAVEAWIDEPNWEVITKVREADGRFSSATSGYVSIETLTDAIALKVPMDVLNSLMEAVRDTYVKAHP